MSNTLGKILKLGVVGASVGVTSINAYQMGKKHDLYEHPDFLTAHNHDVAEMVGVSIGMGQHRSVYTPPKDGFAKDPLRAKLHDDVNEQYNQGKVNSWQKCCIEHVNTELYHQEIPLHPEEAQAIIDAHEDMYDCREDFTQQPSKWCSEKIRTEGRIANAFLEGGSKVGYIAHTCKGMLEASLCMAAQPLVVYGKAMEEEMNQFSSQNQSSTADFREKLCSMKKADSVVPLAASEAPSEELEQVSRPKPS